MVQEAGTAEFGAQTIMKENRAQFQSRDLTLTFPCSLVVPVTHSLHHHQQGSAQGCAHRSLRGGHGVTQENMSPLPPFPSSD